MRTYTKTYTAEQSKTLEQLGGFIAGDESAGLLLELKHDATLNKAKFKYRKPNPRKLELRLKGEVPKEYELVCEGALRIGGESKDVMAIRKKA